MPHRSLACVIAVERFAQRFALLCSRLHSLVVCYDKEFCCMWRLETEGKGRGCVRESIV
jgi:hypothetical protein